MRTTSRVVGFWGLAARFFLIAPHDTSAVLIASARVRRRLASNRVLRVRGGRSPKAVSGSQSQAAFTQSFGGFVAVSANAPALAPE
jgi:hypothetical protein